MDTHTPPTVLKVVISDEIVDVFNFSSISIFSNLSAANVFSCEMQVGEEKHMPTTKKKKKKQKNPPR